VDHLARDGCRRRAADDGAQLGFALLFAALAVWRFRKMEGVIEANGLMPVS
jgi:hypothetical protein